MLTKYDENIGNALSFDELKNLRDEIFAIGQEAAENPPTFMCFFHPRDKSTQEIYGAFVATTVKVDNAKQGINNNSV